MAIRLLRPEEFGSRVKEVRRRLGMGSVELSLALGQDKQYISRLEKAQRKRVDRSEKVLLAEFAEGKGDFTETNAPEILHFLEGEIDWQVSLVPSIAPRGDGGATTDQVSSRWLTLVPSDLPQRTLEPLKAVG